MKNKTKILSLISAVLALSLMFSMFALPSISASVVVGNGFAFNDNALSLGVDGSFANMNRALALNGNSFASMNNLIALTPTTFASSVNALSLDNNAFNSASQSIAQDVNTFASRNTAIHLGNII